MQLRFFLVAVMTIGTMAQLVWAAAISVPAVQAFFPERARAWGQKSLIQGSSYEVPKLRSAAVTTPKTLPVYEAVTVGKGNSEPKPDSKSVLSPALSSNEPGLESTKPILAHAEGANEVSCDCMPPSNGPNVIDLYVGPHIIIVCSELTRTQKLRMGCR